MNKWIKRFLNLAKETGSWSLDPSSKIGSIAVDNTNRIISSGYNGFPKKIADTEKRLNNRDDKYKYTIHAEQNLIYTACYSGNSLRDTTVYVYGLPVCSECAKALIQVGVTKVVMQYDKDISDKWKDSFELTKSLFKEAEIVYISYDLEGNIIDNHR